MHIKNPISQKDNLQVNETRKFLFLDLIYGALLNCFKRVDEI